MTPISPSPAATAQPGKSGVAGGITVVTVGGGGRWVVEIGWVAGAVTKLPTALHRLALEALVPRIFQ